MCRSLALGFGGRKKRQCLGLTLAPVAGPGRGVLDRLVPAAMPLTDPWGSPLRLPAAQAAIFRGAGGSERAPRPGGRGAVRRGRGRVRALQRDRERRAPSPRCKQADPLEVVLFVHLANYYPT